MAEGLKEKATTIILTYGIKHSRKMATEWSITEAIRKYELVGRHLGNLRSDDITEE
jgi:hypothetical protein